MDHLKALELGTLAGLGIEVKYENAPSRTYNLLKKYRQAERRKREAKKTRREQKAKFVRDTNFNTKGEIAQDCPPERLAALTALRKAYERLEGSEISPFGEYNMTDNFFGEDDESLEEKSAPCVEINTTKFTTNAVAFLKYFDTEEEEED